MTTEKMREAQTEKALREAVEALAARCGQLFQCERDAASVMTAARNVETATRRVVDAARADERTVLGSTQAVVDAWRGSGGTAHGCMDTPCPICVSDERARKRLDNAIRADERAKFQADMADQLAQPMQVLLSASETIRARLEQLGTQDEDIAWAVDAIERAVKRADATARGKMK